MTDSKTVSDEALRKANSRLSWLSDACLEEDGQVPPWVLAAKQAVRQALAEGEHD